MHTVVVVDDEPASRRAVERALGEECRVLAAAGGGEALARLAAEPAALLISDQRMPDMLGTQLLEECTLRYPDVVRVLLTGYTEVETLLDAINAGHVWAYLTKPWEPRDLRLVVRRGLEHFDAEAEKRKLLTELQAVCMRVRTEAEQKGRLLALAAHELGTPVHVATNAVELLAAEMPDSAAGRWIDSAREALGWLSRGIEQLQRAGQWTGAGMQLATARFDLDATLARLAACFAAIAATRGLQLDVQLDTALGAFDGDERWIERAVGNVLSNAVRFTADGGHITFAARAGDIIEVTDSGIGIDAALLGDVFEPFSAAGGDIALHSSGHFAFGSRGLGLGLAVAKAVVEAHGGRITLDSTVGEGTTVRIALRGTS